MPLSIAFSRSSWAQLVGHSGHKSNAKINKLIATMNSKLFKFLSTLERSLKIVVILFCFSFVFIAWLQFFGHDYNNVASETKKAIQVIAKRSKNLKYILLWTRADFAPFYYYGKGQTAFIKNNCSHINCFVTSNRKFFNFKMTKFDAILFNGRNLDSFDLPKVRSPNQRYIYMMTESADNYPVCDPVFNNFFNWTATYRLDSDIPMTYIVIRNMNGEIIGPKMKMEWVSLDSQNVSLNEKLYRRIQMKRKTAAWFASKCSTLGGRETAVNRLQKALSSYGLKIDIYGACGNLYCRKNDVACDEILKREYLFYLAFENSLAVDYVTEKVVRALQNDVVPIVYGEADYTRFLPPGSYLIASKYTERYLAAMIYHYSMNRKDYSQFFKWKSYYTFHEPEKVENICKLCAALNNKKLLNEQKTYGDFRSWWNLRHRRACGRY